MRKSQRLRKVDRLAQRELARRDRDRSIHERNCEAWDRYANSVPNCPQPIDVVARVVRDEPGFFREYLYAECPKCGTGAGLQTEGRHLCRRCFALLRYIRES